MEVFNNLHTLLDNFVEYCNHAYQKDQQRKQKLKTLEQQLKKLKKKKKKKKISISKPDKLKSDIQKFIKKSEKHFKNKSKVLT